MVIFGLRNRVCRILSFVLFMRGSITVPNAPVNILEKYHKYLRVSCFPDTQFAVIKGNYGMNRQTVMFRSSQHHCLFRWEVDDKLRNANPQLIAQGDIVVGGEIKRVG